jgi:hypothetical protein
VIRAKQFSMLKACRTRELPAELTVTRALYWRKQNAPVCWILEGFRHACQLKMFQKFAAHGGTLFTPI